MGVPGVTVTANVIPHLQGSNTVLRKIYPWPQMERDCPQTIINDGDDAHALC